MYRTTRAGVEKTLYAIGKSLMSGRGLSSASLAVREAISKFGWMDQRGRADVYGECMALAKSCLKADGKRLPRMLAFGFDGVMMAFNRAYKRTWVGTKRRSVVTGMRLHRQMADPVVFYLVSSHQKPQPAHKDLQGRLLVDYFWRSALENAGIDPTTVARFVRNRKIRTVQWAMGDPHYLITRVNCRHYLIPVRTSYALSHTLTEVRRLEQPRETKVRRPLTDAQRWAEYKDLRVAVLRKLEDLLGKRMEMGK